MEMIERYLLTPRGRVDVVGHSNVPRRPGVYAFMDPTTGG
jgi:hypothetical protein